VELAEESKLNRQGENESGLLALACRRESQLIRVNRPLDSVNEGHLTAMQEKSNQQGNAGSGTV
jgi:hypothetical protein